MNVNGIPVPVHREVPAASSAGLPLLNENTPITGSSVNAVRHFTWYLYVFNVFEDEELSVDEAIELAKRFIQFQVREATVIAARYCLQKCAPEHLDELCGVFGPVKEIQTELAQKIVDTYGSVDLGFVDKSILHLVVTSPELTDIQKLIPIGKWMKINSGDELMKHLFKTVDVENVAMRVKEMEERLIQNDYMINLQEKSKIAKNT